MACSGTVSFHGVIAVLALTLGTASALECYSCTTSAADNPCGSPFNPNEAPSAECPSSLFDRCITVFLDETETWTRSCSIASACVDVSTEVGWTRCCSDDLCNTHVSAAGGSGGDNGTASALQCYQCSTSAAGNPCGSPFDPDEAPIGDCLPSNDRCQTGYLDATETWTRSCSLASACVDVSTSAGWTRCCSSDLCNTHVSGVSQVRQSLLLLVVSALLTLGLLTPGHSNIF